MIPELKLTEREEAAAAWIAQNVQRLRPIEAIKELHRSNPLSFEHTLDLISDEAEHVYTFDGYVAFELPWNFHTGPYGFIQQREETFETEDEMLREFAHMIVGLAGIPSRCPVVALDPEVSSDGK